MQAIEALPLKLQQSAKQVDSSPLPKNIWIPSYEVPPRYPISPDWRDFLDKDDFVVE